MYITIYCRYDEYGLYRIRIIITNCVKNYHRYTYIIKLYTLCLYHKSRDILSSFTITGKCVREIKINTEYYK